MTRARMVQMPRAVPTTVKPAHRVRAHGACGSGARVAAPVAARPRTVPACGHLPQPTTMAGHFRNRNHPSSRSLSCPTAEPAAPAAAGPATPAPVASEARRLAGHRSPKERTSGVLKAFDR